MESIDASCCRSVWGSSPHDWRYLPAAGNAGGVLVMWSTNLFQISDFWLGKHSITCVFTTLASGVSWAFTGVYGPGEGVERSALWNDLFSTKSRWPGPWVVGGDFNTVLDPAERSSGQGHTVCIREFCSTVNQLELIDLPLQGGNYTWCNFREIPSFSRIDRFLVSPDWEDLFPNMLQSVLSRPFSDHAPISLDLKGVRWGPTPFRFENMWLLEDSFSDLVKTWWDEEQVQGYASFVFATKLKRLKGKISKWNQEVFGDVRLKKVSLLEEIKRLDRLEEISPLSQEDTSARDKLKKDLAALFKQETVSWAQKARVKWLKEGDHNSKYFHKLANAHCRSNAVTSIEVGNAVYSEENAIKSEICRFYQNLFTEEEHWRPPFNGIQFERISPDSAALAEAPFTEEEVLRALNDCDGDKAPGPDGFTMEFYKRHWGTLKEDIMAVFHEFHCNADFVSSLNTTFLVLIPKKPGAINIKDFRPISLISSLYKIISKVLSFRLIAVMDQLIGPFQFAFVGKRQITDAGLIANEVLDSQLKSRESGVVVKLDMEKAYDRISWDFILNILEKMGFGTRWRNWIRKCLSSASFSVIVNGCPSGFFHSSRGVRQGDPISSFLFILGMEVFSKMMLKAAEHSLWEGFKICRNSESELNVSHLLFADDTILFGKAEDEHIINLRCILLCFEAVSGLRINLFKSNLTPVGAVPNIDHLAALMGCRKGSFPTTYLGIPLGAKHKSKRIWDPVVQKFEKRLAGWKRGFISKGGRLTLIKSTLSNLPVYYMSLLTIPKSVAKRLETIQSRFLWGSSEEARKFHLISWNTVKQPISNGGLGVKSIVEFNSALLSKWLWRFMNQKDHLWRRVIAAKFGCSHNGWFSETVREPHGCSVWKNISKGWQVFRSHIRWKPGQGNSIFFWSDPWLTSTPLKDRFPQVYSIAADKSALVADYAQLHSGSLAWDIPFIRSAQDWELEEFYSFFDEVYKAELNLRGEDKVVWSPSDKRGFEVKSYYHILHPVAAVGRPPVWPWRPIWKINLPPRVAFFTWEAAWRRILTQDNLQKKGVTLVNRCPMCLCQYETPSHLLLHCQWSRRLWEMVWSIVGISWVQSHSVVDEVLAWEGLARLKKQAFVMAIPSLVWWLIWKERNQRMFEGKSTSFLSIKNKWTSFLIFWATNCKNLDCRSVLDIMDALM